MKRRACSHCYRPGHNIATCRGAHRCSACGKPGHNRQTCQNTNRCGECGEAGHNRRTCLIAAYDDDLDDEFDDDHDVDFDDDRVLESGCYPVVNSRLGLNQGWLDARFETDAWTDEIDALQLIASREHALDRVLRVAAEVAAHALYIGRTAATARNLRSRFDDHWWNRNGERIRPVVRARTHLILAWEEDAIRSVRDRFGCINKAEDGRGRTPDYEPYSLIYIVTCGSRVMAA